MVRKVYFNKWVLIALAIVVGGASIGIGYAAISYKTPVNIVFTNYFDDPFRWVISNDNGTADTPPPPPYPGIPNWGTIDPGDNGMDPKAPQSRGVVCPRETKNVASTSAGALVEPVPGQDYMYAAITGQIYNAYPHYSPTIFFGLYNCGSIRATIAGIDIDEDYNGEGDTVNENLPDGPDGVLTTSVNGIAKDQKLEPGQEVVGRLLITLGQKAEQEHTYHIRVRIRFTTCESGGTMGFWRTWSTAKRYTQPQMQALLTAAIGPIPASSPQIPASCWLASITTTDKMDTLFLNYELNMTNKLKGQLLCTRLNVVANRLNLYNTHNITVVSGYEFLGLGGQSSSAQLWQIIAAIEDRCGKSNNNKQLETMKDILDRINNVNLP